MRIGLYRGASDMAFIVLIEHVVCSCQDIHLRDYILLSGCRPRFVVSVRLKHVVAFPLGKRSTRIRRKPRIERLIALSASSVCPAGIARHDCTKVYMY